MAAMECYGPKLIKTVNHPISAQLRMKPINRSMWESLIFILTQHSSYMLPIIDGWWKSWFSSSIHPQINGWWPLASLRNCCAAAHRRHWTIWAAALWSACRVLHLAHCQWEWCPKLPLQPLREVARFAPCIELQVQIHLLSSIASGMQPTLFSKNTK